ncbi:protein Flattop [Thalassophryne amazonica]|uniref:protein Flattop n=1 Tax=Thalassophryne amazonica TaxID=390379 RepID=UPI00147256A4|nr:protein Flattop [Thalassophryne amazonica]
MSSHYSANQYEYTYKPQRLQNWGPSKHFKERPSTRKGHTTFIADERGHLLPGVVKRGSSWPDFKGTWDLPARLPVHSVNPTSRSVEGLNRLKSWGFVPQHSNKPQPHRGSISTDQLQLVRQQPSAEKQDGAAPSSRPPSVVRPASQGHPAASGGKTEGKNHNSQTTLDASVAQPAEDKQVSCAADKDEPASRPSAAEEKPNFRPVSAAQGKRRSVSNMSGKPSRQKTPSSQH